MPALVDRWAEFVQRFSAFTGLTQNEPNDRFILVLGMTGSGKSSFVSRCTGQDVTIGHDLFSCTNSIDIFSYASNGRQIYLIDTPGFNDTKLPDAEVLEILASYLGASYANRVRIHGILILQPISYNRMSGSNMRFLEIVKAICGLDSYKNLVIVTTMWPEAPSREKMDALEDREVELMADDKFFGDFLASGASIFRHREHGRREDERASARRIIDHLVAQSDRHTLPTLLFQREVVDQGKSLDATTAGASIARTLVKEQRDYETQLRELDGNMRRFMSYTDTGDDGGHDLEQFLHQRISKVKKSNLVLKKTIIELHEQMERSWAREMEIADAKFRLQSLEEDDETQHMQGIKQAGLREKVANFIAPSRGTVATTRAENVQAQQAYNHVRGQKRNNVINGVVNGVCSGTMSAVIAGAITAGVMCTVM